MLLLSQVASFFLFSWPERDPRVLRRTLLID